MSSKYTPGPWRACLEKPGTDSHLPEWSIDSDFGQVATVFAENCDLDEQVACDAKLIAAAPELLAALQGLFEHCSMIHKHWGEDSNARAADAAQAFARAALAKATI